MNYSDDDLYFYRPELIPLYNKNCQLDDQKLKWKESCSKHQMLKDLYGDLKYPKEARENNIEGKVIFQFVIDKKGKVKNRKILKGIGKSCDDEVLRASEIILEWYKPASTLSGEYVNSIVTLPISFQIE